MGQCGRSGRTEEGAAMLAATLMKTPAGKSALALGSYRGVTEQFSTTYCSKAYKIRSLAGINVTPH